MKALGLSLLLAAGLMAGDATQTVAQQTGGGWWGTVARQQQVILEEAARRDREAARQETARQRVYDPRYETGQARKGNGGGPPFCRNGQGHPTKGWQWCVDKGWASAAPYARTTRPAATRGGWTDVIFGPQVPQQPQARGNKKKN